MKYCQLLEVFDQLGISNGGVSKTSHPKKWMKPNSSARENRVNLLMSTLAWNHLPEGGKHTPSNQRRILKYSSKGEEYPLHNKNLKEFYSSAKKTWALGEFLPPSTKGE